MSASAVRTQRASSQMVRDEQHAGVGGVEEDERTGVSPLEWPLAKCAVAGVVQSFNREKKVLTDIGDDLPVVRRPASCVGGWKYECVSMLH